jgi:hypothetical protein
MSPPVACRSNAEDAVAPRTATHNAFVSTARRIAFSLWGRPVLAEFVVAKAMAVVLHCKIVEVIIAAKVCTRLWRSVGKITMIVWANHISKIATLPVLVATLLLLVYEAPYVGIFGIGFVRRQLDEIC